MSTTRCAGLHLDGPIGSVPLSVRGDIGKRVLIADIVRDPFTDRDNVLYGFRQEGLASGVLRQLPEYAGVLLAIVLIEEADGVDDGVRLSCKGRDLAQPMFAGVVASIADHDQHFLVTIALLQVRECGSYRVVQCCLAVGGYARQGNFQLRHLVREWSAPRKAKRNLFVEVDHEHLVLRVAGAREGQGRGNYVSALRYHASTVIDYQADRDRNVLVTEILDRLKTPSS